MILDKQLKGTGIIASNSIGYIEEVFKAYRLQQLIVPLKSVDDSDNITGIQFSKIITPAKQYGWYSPQQKPIDSDTFAQISFTSGTEGNPKGILISHKNLADVTSRLNDIMQVDDSIREYIGVSLTHSFGQARVRAVAAVNGACYIPENGFNPLEISEMLKKGEINAISAVPTLWRLILDNKKIIGKFGELIKWIEIGSQYMTSEEKENLKVLFPNARIIQHYGLTEASRTTFLNISTETGEALSSVGRALGKIKVSLSKNGTIKIKGPNVATHALVNGKIVPLTDKDGWMKTSDLGEIRNGLLYFKGRNDDMINCGGMKISAEMIERELGRRIGNQNNIAVGRTADKIRGDGVIVVYEPSLIVGHDVVVSATKKILHEKGIQIGSALKILAVDEIPRTDNGKIKRSILEDFTGKVCGRDEISLDSDGELTGQQRELVAIWCDILSLQSVSIHSSFFDFGGDSLSTINLMLQMEKNGIDPGIIQDIIGGKTIAQATSENYRTSSGKKNKKVNNIAQISEAINSTRGIMVLLVIFIHWSPSFFDHLSIDYKEIMNPLFRIGTPGFAIIFGLGVGFYTFHQFSINYSKALKNLKVALIMLSLGILMIASLTYFNLRQSGSIYPVVLPAALFYNVLLYYFIAVITVPLWYYVISMFNSKAMAALSVSAIMFGTALLAKELLPNSTGLTGFLRLAGLMVEAKYNYFSMTGTVFLGLALGIYIRKRASENKKVEGLFPVGVMVMLFGMVWSFQAGQVGEWLTTTVAPIWMNVFYLGVIATVLSGALNFSNSPYKSRVPKLIFESLAIFGLLSLPLYVGHRLVIPTRDLLIGFGLPEGVTLFTCLTIFILAAFVALRNLYQLYYGIRKI